MVAFFESPSCATTLARVYLSSKRKWLRVQEASAVESDRYTGCGHSTG